MRWLSCSLSMLASALGEDPCPHLAVDVPDWVAQVGSSSPTLASRAEVQMQAIVMDAALRAWIADQPPAVEPVYRGAFDSNGVARILLVDQTGARLVDTETITEHRSGVAWGYGGAGPHHAALAILVDALALKPIIEPLRARFPELPPAIVNGFVDAFVRRFEQHEPWALPRSAVVDWYNAHPKRPEMCAAHGEAMDGHGCFACEVACGE